MTPFEEMDETLKEWTFSDPSVGIVSPWFNLHRTSENSWFLQGDGDYVVTMIPVRPAIEDVFKQGYQEGSMATHDENQETVERLYELIDELQAKLDRTKDA
jgi:hypothetical protein